MHTLNCTPARARLAADLGTDLDLLIRFQAPLPPKDLQRKPLCLLPVVDVSGSMGGGKLAGVQRALKRVAEHLRPGDFLGLVTFDSDVQVPMHPAELTQETRRRFIAEVALLRSGSNTNFAGGLIAGAAEIGLKPLPQGMRARVLALTDGLANAGPATEAEELRALVRERFDGVTLSAFGYGDDCDQTLLGDLAEAGGGSFAYIDSDDAVLTAFARELGGLASTYAADVRVRVVPLAGAPVEERLGDLLHGLDLSCVMRVPVPARGAGASLKVARVEVRWLDARGGKHGEVLEPEVSFVPAANADPADVPAVARARDERTLRDAQERAEEFVRQGDFGQAQRVLEEAVGRLRDPQLIAFAREQLLPNYANHVSYGSSSGHRSSSYARLKNKRDLLSDVRVDAVLGVKLTEMEAEMEAMFKKAPGGAKKMPQ